MRRFFCGFLCFLLCFSLLGCQPKEEIPILEPVEFFYPKKDFSYAETDTIIDSELREASGHKEDLSYLMELYFRGPQSESLSHPFPVGCGLLSSTVRSNNTITLVVTDTFASLSGLELAIACVCLAKTAIGITGYPKVIIRAKTQLLDGKRSIIIRDGEFALLDDYIAPTQTE